MLLQSIRCIIVCEKDVNHMTTKTITVRVEEDIKKQAELILADIGINLTALLNACLRAVVREKRIPFELVSSEYLHKEMIHIKLMESLATAADDNAKRYTHEEIFKPLREKYGYDIQN